MKKLILLLILSINIVSQPSSNSGKPYKITTNNERFTYTYDGSGNILTIYVENATNAGWQASHRLKYEYDNSRTHQTACYCEYWLECDTWFLSSKNMYTYDTSGNLLEDYREILENNKWHGSGRKTYTYDSSGNKLTYIDESFLNGKWNKNLRIVYTYNSRGDVVTIIKQNCNVFSVWFDIRKETFTYDSSGNKLSYIDQNWNNGWQDIRKYRYTYDNSGNNLTRLIESPDHGSWIINSRVTYTYNNLNKCTGYLWESLYNGVWTNFEKVCRTYNNAGSLLTDQKHNWSGNCWHTDLKYIYSYDRDGNVLHGAVYKGDRLYLARADINVYCRDGIFSSVCAKYFSAEYLYSDNDFTIPPFELSQNYPNPFNIGTWINYVVFREGHVKLSVYDILGCKVADILDEYKLAGSYTLNYNAKDLSSGVYIYRLEINGSASSRKFILLK